MFAAQVEVGVAVVVGYGWIGSPGGGDWRLETWMRRWARLDGSKHRAPDWTAAGWGSAFCISVCQTRHRPLACLPICLCVLQSV